MNIYIRWMGAFRKRGNLHESLKYEINRDKKDEVAVEAIKVESQIRHARIGLLVDNKAVIKTFNGDCWSEYQNGKLYKNRNPRHANSYHREAWAHPVFVGIVVKPHGWRHDNEGFYNLPKKVRSTITWFSVLFGLPIYELKRNGKLIKVKI